MYKEFLSVGALVLLLAISWWVVNDAVDLVAIIHGPSTIINIVVPDDDCPIAYKYNGEWLCRAPLKRIK